MAERPGDSGNALSVGGNTATAASILEGITAFAARAHVFKCDEHGLVEDYLHGYEGRLECPKCAKKDASNI